MSFEPLKDVFSRVMADRRVAVTYTAAETCSMAEKIIFAELPQLAGRVRGKFVRNGELHIATRSAAVSSEIQMASATILGEIQQRFPKIKKLRIKTDYQLFAASDHRGNLG